MPDHIRSSNAFPPQPLACTPDEPDGPTTCDPGPRTCEPTTDNTDVERVSRESDGLPLRAHGSVELCRRPIDTEKGPDSLKQRAANIGAKVHIDHRFLRTPQMEAGMGPEGGGVPHADAPYGKPTTINDHRGQGAAPESSCQPVPNVDEDCVNEMLRYGRPTGLWTPPFNDCHDVVNNIIDDCTPNKEPDAGYVESKDIP